MNLIDKIFLILVVAMVIFANIGFNNLISAFN